MNPDNLLQTLLLFYWMWCGFKNFNSKLLHFLVGDIHNFIIAVVGLRNYVQKIIVVFFKVPSFCLLFIPWDFLSSNLGSNFFWIEKKLIWFANAPVLKDSAALMRLRLMTLWRVSLNQFSSSRCLVTGAWNAKALDTLIRV